ncbi:MAG: aldehyde dehydrogenase [Candidatus Marinimicrobia bacterium]|nr:aldehyde dehydrogenase [Candidatus Neomarinimicrobiota bacterium]
MHADQIKDVVFAQRRFFAGGKTRQLHFRRDSLKKLRKMISDHDREIMKALKEDLGKSSFESYATEIGLVINEIDRHLRFLRRWSRTKRKHTPFILFPTKSRILHRPYGCVLIIAPWNYPFNLSMMPLIGALSAGNCAIVKVAHYSEATSALLEKLIAATFPEEYVRVFRGGRDVNQVLLQQRFDYIFFTGSPSLGKIVAKAAMEHLTPVTLELGGKSPCIVDKDADLRKAARRIVWGKFLNAGQTCIAPDHLLVHWDIKEELLKHLCAEIERQFGTDPSESPDLGRIINDKAFARVSAYLQNGKIVCGGKTRQSDRYIAPTLLDEVSSKSPIMQDEIFGPLLPVLTFENIDEAVKFVSSREKPLALYYFTKDVRGAKKRIRLMDSGGVCINDVVVQYGNPRLPFGGVGNSGMGRYHGKYSFDTFSRERACAISPTLFDIPVKFAPYGNKLRILKKIF